MDSQRISLAQACLDAAYDGSMAFPQIVATLISAGFEGYAVDYRRHVAIYFLPDEDSVELKNPATTGVVAAAFDAAGIAAQVSKAQANGPDYTYAGFCERVKACGCTGYFVSFLGRRVLYFGRTAETHVEHFPQ